VASLTILVYNIWSLGRAIIVCLFLVSCKCRLFRLVLGRVIDSIESSCTAVYSILFLTILFFDRIDLLALDAVVLRWETPLPFYLS
jgi:hypothetical protein